jgi:hypothetical protein
MKIKETRSISDVLPGMILGEAIIDDAGRILVPAATELTESMLHGLIRRDIAELVIELEIEADPQADQARRTNIQQMLDHRFRKAGETPGTRGLYQAISEFLMERQA